MRILLKSTTRCLPKNARLTNNGDPPGRRIFDQFLRGQTSLRAFSSYRGRCRFIEEERENAPSHRARDRHVIDVRGKARRRSLWSVAYRGIIYWNCRYTGSRSLFYPCKETWAHVFRACARACACVTVVVKREGSNRECLIFLTV